MSVSVMAAASVLKEASAPAQARTHAHTHAHTHTRVHTHVRAKPQRTHRPRPGVARSHAHASTRHTRTCMDMRTCTVASGFSNSSAFLSCTSAARCSRWRAYSANRIEPRRTRCRWSRPLSGKSTPRRSRSKPTSSATCKRSGGFALAGHCRICPRGAQHAANGRQRAPCNARNCLVPFTTPHDVQAARPRHPRCSDIACRSARCLGQQRRRDHPGQFCVAQQRMRSA